MNILLEIIRQRRIRLGRKNYIVTVFIFIAGYFVVFAADFVSTDYTVTAPIMFSGEYSTSTSYQLFGTISQVAIGTSSVTGYDIASGFLYFPIVTAPTPSATAGDGQVSLSWSAATAASGWNIGGYNVGQSTSSGGPYTYSNSLGNVTSSNRTGLSNGTTYYFIVRAEDAFGKTIATSSEVSAAPVASAAAAATVSAGGGGILSSSRGTVDISGIAYPGGKLSFLVGGSIFGATTANAEAQFSHASSLLTEGTYVLGVLGQDVLGYRSPMITFPLTIQRNKTTILSGVLLPPTLTTDRIEVRAGDLVTISGRSVPSFDILIYVERNNELKIVKTQTNGVGSYAAPYDTSGLANGRYTARARVVLATGRQSVFSLPAFFEIGERVIEREPIGTGEEVGAVLGDVNNDGRVNIVDFSILAYWFDKQKTQEVPLRIDLTGDGKIDLADFSVAVYYWTG